MEQPNQIPCCTHKHKVLRQVSTVKGFHPSGWVSVTTAFLYSLLSSAADRGIHHRRRVGSLTKLHLLGGAVWKGGDQPLQSFLFSVVRRVVELGTHPFSIYDHSRGLLIVSPSPPSLSWQPVTDAIYFCRLQNIYCILRQIHERIQTVALSFTLSTGRATRGRSQLPKWRIQSIHCSCHYLHSEPTQHGNAFLKFWYFKTISKFRLQGKRRKFLVNWGSWWHKDSSLTVRTDNHRFDTPCMPHLLAVVGFIYVLRFPLCICVWERERNGSFLVCPVGNYLHT